ncbi:family 78 glycoside hydrolase catalytic domain [Paenibacillus odorifer]|uniref:Sugar hydrolase n=1 Tax=Paenibacillus odorifer TaxID=189426 RepID=A0A1R0XVS1_9BACL|nr:family 78 glycoside hydrolase catalytic domain [Paenibacillus odorifer]OMD39220.1 sugar hydrolase [Paenibacillus odorifer]
MTQAMQRQQAVTIHKNEAFALTAEQLLPRLIYRKCSPKQMVRVVKSELAVHGWQVETIQNAETLSFIVFGKGEEVILDFGEHLVGRLTIQIIPIGSPPDAPLHLQITLGEMPVEMAEPFSEYDGWLSSSWLQEERVHLDVLPASLNLERRYSFRYVKLKVLDTSPKYKVSFAEISCTAETSADRSFLAPLDHLDAELQAIDEVSVKTLEECMQEVFEDGPKRDRRLWLGDLRLQALANYETFSGNDLVKRCLYLFAAYPDERGRITANLFMKPHVIPDDTYLYDYSLFFVSTLCDYFLATDDRNTLEELWPSAYRQIELALERLDERGIVTDDETWWAFIDWHPDLNKQTPAQAILIYNLKCALELAVLLGDERQDGLRQKIEELTQATLEHLWDSELSYFVSGDIRQVSWASQIWMVLAGVVEEEERGKEILLRLQQDSSPIPMTTPYMVHHFIEALIQVGDRDNAISEIKKYWGQMIKDGADTFWELYNPSDKSFSPYGSHLINSYCHAWSCTPTYLIRKYQL